MSTVRRPKPQSLASVITAFNASLPLGDGDVEVPAATWAEFLAARSVPTSLVLQLEARVAELERERAKPTNERVAEYEALRNFRRELAEIFTLPAEETHLQTLLAEVLRLKTERREANEQLNERIGICEQFQEREDQLKAALGDLCEQVRRGGPFDTLSARTALGQVCPPEPEPFDPLPPAKKVPDPGGPFQVLVASNVDGSPLVLSERFDDRQEAYNWATRIGHRSFKVHRADGSICDVVELPAKKQRKPRAKRAAKTEPTPLEQAIDAAGGAP